MQDRKEPSQPIFTVKDCGCAEFNGKYFVDYGRVASSFSGKVSYRKNGAGDAESECTIEFGEGLWLMTKNYGSQKFYSAASATYTNQPPTGGWKALIPGSAPPPQLVYEADDVPNFYFFLYE